MQVARIFAALIVCAGPAFAQSLGNGWPENRPPANVEAQISVTTAFGAKFVDLVYPVLDPRLRRSSGKGREAW